MPNIDYAHQLAFPKLSDSEVECLADLAKVCSFDDGANIFQAGQRGVPLYVVESGEIVIMDESRAEPHTVARVHGRCLTIDGPSRRHLRLCSGSVPSVLR
jgi:CRP-like cAMP-binding protein